MSDKAAGASSDPVLKREPASPESRGISPFDASIRGGPFCVGVNSTIASPPPTSSEMVVPSQNGSLQNQGSGSESDSGVDAPLDFSMKSRVKKRELETPQRLENTGAPKRRALNIEASSENSNSCSPVARYHVKTEQPEGLLQTESQTQSPPTGLLEDGKNGMTEDSKRAARFGEPPTALPGSLPGAVGAAMPGLGMLPNAFAASLPMYMDPRRLQQAQTQATNGNGSSGSSKSNARPFKAYPKEALSLPLGYYGIPGMMPFPSLDSVTAQAMGQAMGSEELFNQYRMYVLKCQQEQAKNSAKSGGAQGQAAPPLPQLPTQQNQPATQQSSPVANPAANNASQASPSAKSTTSETSSTVRSTSSSPTLSTTCTTPTSPGGGADPATATSGGGSAGDSKPRTPVRKRGQQMPDERKDESYWERRRKNNEAAKRSRDSRRAKEDEIAIRAAFLEQENLKLRVEVAALKNETAKLRCMLYNS